MDEKTKRAQSIVGTSPGRPDDDFYPTPAYVTQALLDNVASFRNPVWECACGDGAISEVLLRNRYQVASTDLYDHGYGISGIDFLKEERLLGASIITNPPYSLATEFISHGLKLGVRQMAILAKLALLEGQKRSEILKYSPLKWVLVFKKRVQLTRNGLPYKNGGMIAFAWFVWENGYNGRPMVDWI